MKKLGYPGNRQGSLVAGLDTYMEPHLPEALMPLKSWDS